MEWDRSWGLGVWATRGWGWDLGWVRLGWGLTAVVPRIFGGVVGFRGAGTGFDRHDSAALPPAIAAATPAAASSGVKGFNHWGGGGGGGVIKWRETVSTMVPPVSRLHGRGDYLWAPTSTNVGCGFNHSDDESNSGCDGFMVSQFADDD